MLRRNLIIFTFIFLYLCIYKVQAIVVENNLPLLSKIIYIDAGHGGYCKIQK